ncbi:hypothetical protein SAMN06296241_2974 [Salinimicrobium sediminis]|uniref:Membrane domain of glycerophosphoryl diester phosphodiesterase n=1 Tax=Salinimicrobium sediminis TaxID=1343891 RepID=A0A285X7X7_9FLAO|nr:hypothetical protein [Salinimicrobium sediminis]SOC81398.1 hypothetical protein SAMN06296241_2974 [Salinimicrobium sediminis]
MSKKTIEFKKQRELGDIITDTFKFLRQNFKPLFKAIFKITGPVFVILLFAIGYYSYLGMDILQNPFFGDNEDIDVEMYFIALFILFSSLLAFYVLLYGTVLNYIKSYIRNSGMVDNTEVFQGVKNDFGSMLAIMIVSGIITIFGLLLCVLPGIYVWVPLSLAPAMLVFARTSIADSISYAFSLIKDNWWSTFFTLFVLTLLVYLIGMIFQFPMMIYMFIKAFTISQQGSAANPAELIDWVYVFFNVISSLFQYLLSVILIVASAFIYHHLDEKKNATGSYERISNLGS